jgi:uncharacterized membrane protein
MSSHSLHLSPSWSIAKIADIVSIAADDGICSKPANDPASGRSKTALLVHLVFILAALIIIRWFVFSPERGGCKRIRFVLVHMAILNGQQLVSTVLTVLAVVVVVVVAIPTSIVIGAAKRRSTVTSKSPKCLSN